MRIYFWIFMRIFLIKYFINLWIPETVAPILSQIKIGDYDFSIFITTGKSLAKTGLPGVDYNILINLFAYSVEYKILGSPNLLKPVISHVTRTPDVTEIATRGHAANRVAENENIRGKFFEQLNEIFPFKKPRTAEMYDGNFINSFMINMPQAQRQGPSNGRFDIDKIMKDLTEQVINKVLPGYARIRPNYARIRGEAALRIGAELYRQLYFIDGALYKSMKEEKFIQDAFPEEVNAKAKHKMVTDEDIAAIRSKKKKTILNRFIETWKTVHDVMDVLAKYQSEYFVESARNLDEQIKKQNKMDKSARSNRNVDKYTNS
ncbi:hypothetical protein DdX_15592 [Ditylenchus destructor]|uniref:Uncharacterized protein n=1 Tax=Ditylenchus destructor TaxID=166010 RepID=A0AAD4R0N4_9BILA|nr:hypothetical protein DdX_15592 [Ditylenchus destructor]